MTGRKLSAFIDALVSGRRPGRFSPTPDDVDVLRMAISLRAERPGDATPDDEFVSALFEELKAQASSRAEPDLQPVRMTGSGARPDQVSQRGRFAMRRSPPALLVAGTTSATEAFNHARTAPAAVAAPRGDAPWVSGITPGPLLRPEGLRYRGLGGACAARKSRGRKDRKDNKDNKDNKDKLPSLSPPRSLLSLSSFCRPIARSRVSAARRPSP